MNERYGWFLKLRTCKKLGCNNSAVIGEAYCCREHAPLSHWNLEDEPLDGLDGEVLKPHSRFRREKKKQEEEIIDVDVWINTGYFAWNEKD